MLSACLKCLGGETDYNNNGVPDNDGTMGRSLRFSTHWFRRSLSAGKGEHGSAR